MNTSTNPDTQKSDPVGDNYYSHVVKVDRISGWLFYVGAALSIGVLFIDRVTNPSLYSAANYIFLAVAITLFVLGMILRLYLTPRAEHQRRRDFFSNALGVKLTHETSVKYYNNEETDPIRRTAAQLLENLHFTKKILLEMLRPERIRIATYILLWGVCFAWQRADIGLLVAVSQLLFSEQLAARWMRMEWFRLTSEHLYDETFQSFASNGDAMAFRALTLDAVVTYEAAKAFAAVPLSSTVFSRLNGPLSHEWECIKRSLEMKT